MDDSFYMLQLTNSFFNYTKKKALHKAVHIITSFWTDVYFSML